MTSPLAITKKLVLNQKDDINSSEKEILNKMEEYMEQFGMLKFHYSENELYYLKSVPFWLFRKMDHLGNLSITVSCTNQEIAIVLKTNTELLIISFVVIIVAVILVVGNPFTFSISDKPLMWLLLAYGLLTSAWRYFKRIRMMNRIQNEILLTMKNFHG